MNVFVFGSNVMGNHAGGAAKIALVKHGAVMGEGFGLHGQSYAIPTIGQDWKPLPLDEVAVYVRVFLAFAENEPLLNFQITRIGCGIAGFKDGEIAPLFASAPANCSFDEKWKEFLPCAEFWGTY